jgi:hypothetical protein
MSAGSSVRNAGGVQTQAIAPPKGTLPEKLNGY